VGAVVVVSDKNISSLSLFVKNGNRSAQTNFRGYLPYLVVSSV
jgi:hypothetical protein